MERRDLAPAIGLVALSSVVALSVAVNPKVALGMGGVAAIVVAFRWPAASLLFVAITCQELEPPGGGLANSLFAFGHQVYFVRVLRVPLITVLLVAAVAGALARRPKGGRRGLMSLPVAVGVCLALVALFAALLGGQGVVNGVSQDALPFLVVVAAAVVGATIDLQPGGVRRLTHVGLIALALAAALGAAQLAVGKVAVQSPDPIEGTLSRYLLFYDSALPAVAAAVVVVLVLQRRRGFAIHALTGFIVLFSFRRNIWLAGLLVLIVAIVLRGDRVRTVGRLLIGTAALTAGLAVLTPQVLRSVEHHAAVAFDTVRGTASESSTARHLQDISFGWHRALAKPIAGYGPEHRQFPELQAADQPIGRVYIHNEYLLDWIRFGVLGFVGIILLLIAAAHGGLGALRRPGRFSTDRQIAAAFVLMTPIAVYTAPFLSTTARWPVLFGLAVGLLTRTLNPGDHELLGGDLVVDLEPAA